MKETRNQNDYKYSYISRLNQEQAMTIPQEEKIKMKLNTF